ncbi:MAG: PQQ-binding-like beta-propeller repeat protein [Candidatus Bathyarchaeia archaeon]
MHSDSEKKGKSTSRKNIAATAALFLIALTVISAVSFLPVAFAQTKVRTTAFAFANPQLVGKGQTVWLVGWISPPTGVGNQKYANLTMTVTKPDGTTKTVFFDLTDVGAAVNTNFVCDQAGTYSVKLTWAGDARHLGSESPPYSWTVQQDPIDFSLPKVPLPTGYWRFPISAQYYEWYQISGPWAQNRYDATQAQFNPYSKGPNTPHILWRKQVVPGGLAGGGEGWNSIQGSFAPNTEVNIGLANYVAAQGRLYYTTRDFANNYTQTRILLHCVDMYTGQDVYNVDLDWPIAAPSTNPNAFPPGRPNLFLEVVGQSKGGTDVRTATVTGAYSLWVSGNGLREVDPMTGQTIYQRTDVSPSVFADGYFYISSGGNLSKWSTRAKVNVWTVPGLGSPTYVYKDILVYSTKSYDGYIRTTTYDANTGKLIANGTLQNLYSITLSQCVADGKVFYSGDDLRMHAVDLLTCQEVWVSDPMKYPYGSCQAYSQSAAYGLVYSGMLDGYVYCWNTTNGNLVWKRYLGNTSYTAFGTYPMWGNIVIADGKLYGATGEHTTPNPIPYGYSLYCLDAFTGDVIWNYPSFCMYTFASVGFGSGISAGMVFYQNNEDGCLYCFGQGQSETAVTASPKVATKGSSVLIEGTVKDISPGAKGTPAISDDGQSAWGQYLYNNAPQPANATGVTVLLQAVFPDGTVNDITHVTSDARGCFSYLWKPQAEGKYTIVAKFEGSDSYYPSSAETAIGVDPAPAQPAPVVASIPTAPPTTTPPTPTPTPVQTVSPSPTSAPQPEAPPPTDMYVIAGVAAAVVTVVAAAAIVLRRRK